MKDQENNKCPTCRQIKLLCKCAGGGAGEDEKEEKDEKKQSVNNLTSQAVILSNLAYTSASDNLGFDTWLDVPDSEKLPLIDCDPENLRIAISMGTMGPQDFKDLVTAIKIEIEELMKNEEFQGHISIEFDNSERLVIQCSDAKTYNNLVSHLLDQDLLPGVDPDSVEKAVHKKLDFDEVDNATSQQHLNENSMPAFNPTPFAMVME